MSKNIKKSRRTIGHRKKRKQAAGLHGVSSHQNMFREALALHQAGRLPQAEALYRQILATEPSHPEALHFLGMLAHQVGKNEIAVELIGKALSCRPDYVEAHINLGNALNAQGKTAEAVASYRRALTLKPDLPDAHYNLGNALKTQDKLAEAAASYRRALSLKPDDLDAQINLGNVLKAQGKLEDAIASYRRVLSLKPDFPYANINLGNALKAQGRLDEAVASYRRALSLKPDYVEALINLGNALYAQDNLDEAVASFRRVLTLKPDDVEAHYNLGFIFKQLGKLDDAAFYYKKTLSLEADHVMAYKGLSQVMQYAEVDEVVRAMEDLYANKREMSDVDHIVLGFALGKVFEDLGDYPKSFAFLLEANRLKRESYEYSIQEDHDLFARIKKTFSPDFFASHQGAGSQDRTPIFIVGMPRSGTTLVEQILASHPLVFGAGELMVLEDLINRTCPGQTTAKFPECILSLGPDAYTGMGTEYIEKIREFSNDAGKITDKMPHNFLRVGLIRTILPNAKVIHCMRSPMDTCFSIFKKDFQGTHGYAYDLVELGKYYNLYLDLMAYWEKVLPGFMYPIRYEELVADQQNQTKGLLEFCGLEWHEACLAFHKTARRIRTASLTQVRQPIYKDSVDLWKRYEKQLEPLRNAIYG